MHDHAYKLLFSHARMVEDLLRGLVPEPWVAELDFTTLEKVSASHASDDLRARHNDVIWRVRWGPRWLYVYLMLEFQSTVDPFMAVRVMTYVSLLYQDLIRTRQLTDTAGRPHINFCKNNELGDTRYSLFSSREESDECQPAGSFCRP